MEQDNRFRASHERAQRYGRPRHSNGRAAFEFYPTPPEATRALLSVEQFDGDVWEPACGKGWISEVLQEAGYDVVSTDLIDYGYGRSGIDFLKATKARAKNIVTNPPYGRHGLADAFIRKALALTKETGGSVAMLLNLRSLCHPVRHGKFRASPPAALYAIDELYCSPDRKEGRIARQQYVWSVWRPAHRGRPSFWWLSASQFPKALATQPK